MVRCACPGCPNKKGIPRRRIENARLRGGVALYCSDKCVARAKYLRAKDRKKPTEPFSVDWNTDRAARMAK